MFEEYAVPLAFNAIGTLAMLALSGFIVWWFLRKRSAPTLPTGLSANGENDLPQTERLETLERFRTGGLIDESTYQSELRRILGKK